MYECVFVAAAACACVFARMGVSVCVDLCMCVIIGVCGYGCAGYVCA